MTENRCTVTGMSGRVHLTIQLAEQNPEPIMSTCYRAVTDLTAQGVIPALATIADVCLTSTHPAESDPRTSLQCTISWVHPPDSDATVRKTAVAPNAAPVTMPGAQAHAEGREWHHSDYGPEFIADIVHLGKRDTCPGQHVPRERGTS